MRLRIAAALILGVLLCVAGSDVRAHHAVQAAFDQDDHATLTGVLTKVLWINPHVRWFLDVKDETGKVTTWTISGAGPAVLVWTTVEDAGKVASELKDRHGDWAEVRRLPFSPLGADVPEL